MTHADPREADDSGLWPSRRTPVLDWLVKGTRDQRFLDNIFVELCRRLEQHGVPLVRAGMFLETLHPQWLGVRIMWRRGMTEADMRQTPYGARETEAYRLSPAAAIYDGARSHSPRASATSSPSRRIGQAASRTRIYRFFRNCCRFWPTPPTSA